MGHGHTGQDRAYHDADRIEAAQDEDIDHRFALELEGIGKSSGKIKKKQCSRGQRQRPDERNAAEDQSHSNHERVTGIDRAGGDRPSALGSMGPVRRDIGNIIDCIGAGRGQPHGEKAE